MCSQRRLGPGRSPRLHRVLPLLRERSHHAHTEVADLRAGIGGLAAEQDGPPPRRQLRRQRQQLEQQRGCHNSGSGSGTLAGRGGGSNLSRRTHLVGAQSGSTSHPKQQGVRTFTTYCERVGSPLRCAKELDGAAAVSRELLLRGASCDARRPDTGFSHATDAGVRPLRIETDPQVEALFAATYSQAGALGGVWTALAWRLTVKHRVSVAIFILPLVTTCCWSSELLAARAQDLAPPSRQVVSYWSLLIASRHQHRATKKGVFSDSVLLDAPHTAFLNPTLKVLQGNGGNALLQTFTYPDLAGALAETASELRASVTAYQARHCRPSIDLAWKLRDITSVQKRCRWVAMSSVVRNERHARLATEWPTPGRPAGANESRISCTAAARHYICLTAGAIERALIRDHQRSGWRWEKSCCSRVSCARL